MARKALTARLNALHTERLAAVDVFTRSAAILEETAIEYQVLADEAYAEANERQLVAADATVNATAAWEQAQRIRELAR
jgi:hypothetical protein